MLTPQEEGCAITRGDAAAGGGGCHSLQGTGNVSVEGGCGGFCLHRSRWVPLFAVLPPHEEGGAVVSGGRGRFQRRGNAVDDAMNIMVMA